METNGWHILCQFLPWAAGAQSHMRTLGDRIGATLALSQLRGEGAVYLSAAPVPVAGGGLLLRALTFQHPQPVLHEGPVCPQCLRADC